MSERGLWIAPVIWCNDGLSLVDKTILALVHSFTANGLQFFQTNDTISEQIGVSQSTVKRSLQKLGELGLLEFVAFNGRTRQMSHQQGQKEPPEGSK